MESLLKISFSHNYPKLHGQKLARLMAIEIKDRKELSDKFIQYDTLFKREYLGLKDGTDDFYPLPAGKYLMLLFWGDSSIPFTTARPWSFKKAIYYQGNVGKLFKINIKEST